MTDPRQVEERILDTWDFTDPAGTAERFRRAADERALAEIEASEDPKVRRWLGSVLNNLGWDLHDLGHPEQALLVFERAVAVRAETDDHQAWVVARWCVGRTLLPLGRYDAALALVRELAADTMGAEDDHVHEEIALNRAALGRHDTP